MFSQSLHKWCVITLLNQQKGQTSAVKKRRSCEPDMNSQNTMPIELHPNKNTSLPRHWVFSFKTLQALNHQWRQTSQVALSSSSFPRMRKGRVQRLLGKPVRNGKMITGEKTWWKQYEWCFGHLLASTIPHLFQSIYMSVLYCWGEWSEDKPCWPTLLTFRCVWMLIHKWF